MKFLGSQIGYLLSNPEGRSNLRALVRYVALLLAVILAYAIAFHYIMERYEGRTHSWITGLYWTLTVMTTLGFGDITFESDPGRLFSIVVLVSGLVLLLVMLPFLFIRLFYAPWLEARLRHRAPRRTPAGMAGHVLVARHDTIAAGLVERLRAEEIPCFVLEPDPASAARLYGEDVPVIAGEVDNRLTYDAARVEYARLVLANCSDADNTNITLTIREVSATVPISAIVEDEDSVDILQLAGATHVLPLKVQLGEFLANRVQGVRNEAHVIGTFHNLRIAELPARGTPLANQPVRDTHLRATTGLNIVGLWQRGRLQPAYPHTVITEQSVVVVVGTESQLETFNAQLPRKTAPGAPVLVIGAGTVGVAAVRALKAKGLTVHVLDADERAYQGVRGLADRACLGDAAERQVLLDAGLERSASVLLTTNDDAVNIYLAVYCRRLKSDLRIVSRITHDRNLEAIHRAGADFVLSYASLGTQAIVSLLKGHEAVTLGAGVDLFTVSLPKRLQGRSLRESGIGSRTGLSVIAVQQGGQLTTNLDANLQLGAGTELIMLGSLEQRLAFGEAFGA